jgi:hypothetical protein
MLLDGIAGLHCSMVDDSSSEAVLKLFLMTSLPVQVIARDFT